jgi:hypothetical protein
MSDPTYSTKAQFIIKCGNFYRNPAGPEGPSGKGDNRPEASHWRVVRDGGIKRMSEHKSRVIEPRNIQIAGTFVFMSTGAVPERRMPSAMVRPESTPAPPVQRSPLERAERCSSAAPPLPAFHGVGRGEGLVPLP